MNLVILKKSADSDENDDSIYAVDSGDSCEYGKYGKERLLILMIVVYLRICYESADF